MVRAVVDAGRQIDLGDVTGTECFQYRPAAVHIGLHALKGIDRTASLPRDGTQRPSFLEQRTLLVLSAAALLEWRASAPFEGGTFGPLGEGWATLTRERRAWPLVKAPLFAESALGL